MIGKITLDPAHVENPLRDVSVVAGADAFLPSLDAVPDGATAVSVAVTDAAGTVHPAAAVAGDDGFWHAHFAATEFAAAFVGTYRVTATVPDETAAAQTVVCGEGSFVATDGLGSAPTATGYWLNMRGTVADAASLPATARKGWAYLVGTAEPFDIYFYTGSAWVSCGVASADVAAVANSIDAHAARTDNPHQVTAAQIGAATPADVQAEEERATEKEAANATAAAAAKDAADAHAARTDNPHGVTAAQVGAVTLGINKNDYDYQLKIWEPTKGETPSISLGGPTSGNNFLTMAPDGFTLGDGSRILFPTKDANGGVFATLSDIPDLPSAPQTLWQKSAVVDPATGAIALAADTTIYTLAVADAAVTLAVTKPAAFAQPTATFELLVVMPATVQTITWFTGLTWLDGTPTLKAGKKYLFVFRTFDSGATWIGNLQGSW